MAFQPGCHNYITQTCQCIMQRFLKTIKMIFLDEKFEYFLIFDQNIDCGYMLGGSNQYPQSMFQSKNKKIKFTPVNPNYTL